MSLSIALLMTINGAPKVRKLGITAGCHRHGILRASW